MLADRSTWPGPAARHRLRVAQGPRVGMTDSFVGIDAGTGSAHAGIVDATGRLLATASAEIDIHREDGGIVEQSSEQVWGAVRKAVREVLVAAGTDPATIRGLGFDATCSLIVRGAGGTPLTIGNPPRPELDIIVWMDHRASDQAVHVNAQDHDVLAYMGGKKSPEMQTPKLLWLKENTAETCVAAENFVDLTDFLGWKATGSLERSTCKVTTIPQPAFVPGVWGPYYSTMMPGDVAERRRTVGGRGRNQPSGDASPGRHPRGTAGEGGAKNCFQNGSPISPSTWPGSPPTWSGLRTGFISCPNFSAIALRSRTRRPARLLSDMGWRRASTRWPPSMSRVSAVQPVAPGRLSRRRARTVRRWRDDRHKRRRGKTPADPPDPRGCDRPARFRHDIRGAGPDQLRDPRGRRRICRYPLCNVSDDLGHDDV